MKFKNYLWLIGIAIFVGLSLTLSACSSDDSDEESKNQITITNKTANTLYLATVVFYNNKEEVLSERNFGSLYPGATINADIPTGAVSFRFYINNRNLWLFTPVYYLTDTKSLAIKDDALWYYSK